MFNYLKNKIDNIKAEAKKKKEEERRKEEERKAEIKKKQEEKERLEREKIEKEKTRLMALDEKELLVEMMFILKEIVKEQKILKEQVEDCQRVVDTVQTNIVLLENNISELNSDVNFLKYN